MHPARLRAFNPGCSLFWPEISPLTPLISAPTLRIEIGLVVRPCHSPSSTVFLIRLFFANSAVRRSRSHPLEPATRHDPCCATSDRTPFPSPSVHDESGYLLAADIIPHGRC